MVTSYDLAYAQAKHSLSGSLTQLQLIDITARSGEGSLSVSEKRIHEMLPLVLGGIARGSPGLCILLS